MGQASNALEDYGLDQWTLVEGSSAAMMAELKKAYDAAKTDYCHRLVTTLDVRFFQIEIS